MACRYNIHGAGLLSGGGGRGVGEHFSSVSAWSNPGLPTLPVGGHAHPCSPMLAHARLCSPCSLSLARGGSGSSRANEHAKLDYLDWRFGSLFWDQRGGTVLRTPSCMRGTRCKERRLDASQGHTRTQARVRTHTPSLFFFSLPSHTHRSRTPPDMMLARSHE